MAAGSDELILDPLAPVYLIHGPESFLRGDALEAVTRAALDPDLADFNMDRFEGGQDPMAAAVGAAQTLPVMAERRLVVVRSLERVKDAELALLADYVADPSPSTCLVLEGEKVDMRRAPFTTIKKVGRVVACQPLYERQLVPWILGRVRAMGRRIAPEAAQFLASYTGSQLATLMSELSKAADYAGDGPIDLEAVEQTVGQGRVHTVFELTDALGERRAGPAMTALGTLLDAGEAPLKVQAMIVRQFRLIWRAREARRSGQGNLAKALGVAPFLANKLSAQASRYRDPELVVAFNRFARVDLQLKGDAVSPRRVLESEVLELCG